ncbi:MAG: hypothetical protein KC466_03755 [Myxococcales bacterium]|nr:hypothetical protein [Myxococcales bacterium]
MSARWIRALIVAGLPWIPGVARAQQVTDFPRDGWSTKALSDEFDTRSMTLAGVRSVRGDSFYCFMGPEREALHRPWCLFDVIAGAPADATRNPELRFDEDPAVEIAFSKELLPHGSWYTDGSFTMVPGDEVIGRLRRARTLTISYTDANGEARSVTFALRGSGAALDAALAARPRQ